MIFFKRKFFYYIFCIIFICNFKVLQVAALQTTLLTKNTRVYVRPSVYDASKYSNATVTPRTFLKIILSHSFVSCSSFCVNIYFQKLPIICAALGHVTVKNLIE